jgi:hypothetical protein
VKGDRTMQLLSEFDIVMKQICRESKRLRKDSRKALKLLASGKTRKALKRIARLKDSRMEEMISYMQGIIYQVMGYK